MSAKSSMQPRSVVDVGSQYTQSVVRDPEQTGGPADLLDPFADDADKAHDSHVGGSIQDGSVTLSA